MSSLQEIYDHLKENNFSFSTDTRKIKKDDIFFAFKGGNFNGNAYAVQALKLGAKYAVIDENAYAKGEKYLLVEDVLQTFQDLATHHRKLLNIPVIGIAGSNGKTTTKELTAAVLSKKYRVHVTPGNFNNHIGLPITLLTCPKDAEIMIAEMGANHAGEIEALCQIARPDYGLITNIGKEHLEGFGSLEGVAKAESEIYQYLLENQGQILVNMNDVWLHNMTKRFAHYFGYGHPENEQYFVSGTLEQASPHIKANVNDYIFESVLMGDYNFDNILAAITIGKLFDVPFIDMQQAIGDYHPQNNRSQWVKTENNNILLDAYNANPSSMEKAINNFALSAETPKMMILGDMFELGSHADAEHSAIAALAKSKNVDQILFAGACFYKHKQADQHLYFSNYDDLKAHLENNHIAHKHILIKGSRGMALERLVALL